MKKQWRAVPREELEVSGQRVIEDGNGDEVAYVGFDEDAEFIATACNAHAGLVEALQDMVSAMESYGYPHGPEVITARATLAKAGAK